MMAASGKIIDVNLITGKVNEGVNAIYYSGANCTGAPYLDYRIGAAFPTLGRIVRTKSDNRYFEVVGFADAPVSLSNRLYINAGQFGVCQNEAKTLGNSHYGSKAAVLQSVSAPDNLESLAPIRLQLE